MKRQWYYRGSLRSCNYACSYCPFSKQIGSARQLREDKEALFRFVERINGMESAEGAVQIVPYGEALIYDYYWQGLAALSRNPRLDAVGAQSNFSFSVEQMLDVYRAYGGILDKLRLWGTFHPQMTAVKQFVSQCTKLSACQVQYCVGAVGVPAHLEAVRCLRKELPQQVYLWINKMDGLGRRYTEGEIAAFAKIDAYFGMELAHYTADTQLCADNRFVEADGTAYRCNLCQKSLGNLYDGSWEEIQESGQTGESMHGLDDRYVCGRKECSCYLAYCNRLEGQMAPFGPYPAFRIPAGR